MRFNVAIFAMLFGMRLTAVCPDINTIWMIFQGAPIEPTAFRSFIEMQEGKQIIPSVDFAWKLSFVGSRIYKTPIEIIPAQRVNDPGDECTYFLNPYTLREVDESRKQGFKLLSYPHITFNKLFDLRLYRNHFSKVESELSDKEPCSAAFISPSETRPGVLTYTFKSRRGYEKMTLDLTKVNSPEDIQADLNKLKRICLENS